MSELEFVPIFEGPIEGYVANFLKKNLWRVAKTMEYEDVMQEAKVVFLEVKYAYPQVDTPQWFMALFKTSWFNRFQDLSTISSNASTAMLEADMYSEESETDGYDIQSAIGDLDMNGELAIKIKEAPSEVKTVLSLFLNAPQELLNTVCESWKESGKKKVLGNTMLCKMLGMDPSKDVVKLVHDYFTKNN